MDPYKKQTGQNIGPCAWLKLAVAALRSSLFWKKNTFWWSTLTLCRNFAPGQNWIFPWRSLSSWSKFSYKKIKSNHYGILEGYQPTFSGVKSKMKTTQNAHNTPVLFFHMKLWTYLRRLSKEKEFFIHGQSQKNSLKVFEIF